MVLQIRRQKIRPLSIERSNPPSLASLLNPFDKSGKLLDKSRDLVDGKRNQDPAARSSGSGPPKGWAASAQPRRNPPVFEPTDRRLKADRKDQGCHQDQRHTAEDPEPRPKPTTTKRTTTVTLAQYETGGHRLESASSSVVVSTMAGQAPPGSLRPSEHVVAGLFGPR